MTDLEKIRSWLNTYPEIGKAQALNVDYYSQDPGGSNLAPSGLVEVSRKEDILGNVTVENQYNFAISFGFDKPLEDDATSTQNAEWLLAFQRWVQEQGIRRQVPVFGDDPRRETVKAQNGELSYADIDGNGIYTVMLSINFIKIYEVN